MKIQFLLWLLMFVQSLSSKPQTNKNKVRDDDEKRLMKKLFDNYDPEIRPVYQKSDTVKVTFGVSLFQIIAVDFKNQVLKMSTWTRQAWYNPFLAWNESEFGGITTLNVNPKRIWKPDIYLYNNVAEGEDGAMDSYKTKTVINSTGHIMWLAPKIITSSCGFDVAYFPFDEQYCILKFGSWTFDGFRLDLVPEAPSADTDKYIRNGEWMLMSMRAERNQIVYVCCPEPYPDITYTVHLRRKPMFYFVNVIAPCFLISGLTLLSFYLPPDCGERLGLVITNLLALTVFLLLVAEIIPATSDVVPLVSVFFYGNMFQIALALFATCFVLKCHFNNPTHTPLPAWIRLVVLKWLAKLLRVDVKKDIKDQEKRHKGLVPGRESSRQSSTAQIHDKVTLRKLRNRCSEIYRGSHVNVATAVETGDCNRNIFLSPDMDFSCCSSRNPSYTNLERAGLGQSRTHLAREVNDARGPGQRSLCDDYVLRSLLHSQECISRDVRELVHFAREQEEGEERKDEWILVAYIVDQFFLYLFIAVLLLFSLIVFFNAPKYMFGL